MGLGIDDNGTTSDWKWHDSSDSNWSNWADGQPHQDHVRVSCPASYDGGLWYGMSCDHNLTSACEVDAANTTVPSAGK